MKVRLEESWMNVLAEEFEKPYFKSLTDFIREEYQSQICYPKAKDIFNAFYCTPFPKVKVVILGQDPYHGEGQAHGLSFSVPNGILIPPSLRNIFKEIEEELEFPTPQHGNLENWAKQGVFLLNSTLTVRASRAGSHQGIGWEKFTDTVIEKLSSKSENLVFMLWGKFAISKASLIDKNRHLVLTAAHPSPFSAHRGFFGCDHFKKCNQFLKEKNIQTIDWIIEN